MQEVIGGDERVVRGVEVHEPVPSAADPQQQRGAVQRGGERGRAARIGEAGVPDDMDVVAAGRDGTSRAARSRGKL